MALNTSLLYLFDYPISSTIAKRTRLSTDEERTEPSISATMIHDTLDSGTSETAGSGLRNICKREAQAGSLVDPFLDPFRPPSPDSSQPDLENNPIPENREERHNRENNPSQSGENVLVLGLNHARVRRWKLNTLKTISKHE
jgi:hypothetical protein